MKSCARSSGVAADEGTSSIDRLVNCFERKAFASSAFANSRDCMVRSISAVIRSIARRSWYGAVAEGPAASVDFGFGGRGERAHDAFEVREASGVRPLRLPADVESDRARIRARSCQRQRESFPRVEIDDRHLPRLREVDGPLP